jgi:hypothetical protein
MGINLPDLIIESVIKDGIQYLKDNPEKLDRIFAPLLNMYASRKYGQAEIDKIKAMINTKNIAIAHSFHEAAAKSPCYSIQLGAESEAKDRAHIGDFEMQREIPITDQSFIIKVDNLIPTSYDPTSGKVVVSDSYDLTPVHAGYKYVDGDANTFEVQRGISNVPGSKYFFIKKFETPNIVGAGLIKTFLSYTIQEERGDTSAINMLIGVHSKDALLTKYLYVILKHIFKARKNSLVRRGIVNSTFQGSDFTRDLKYEGDMVFTRFFTLSGQVDDTWDSIEGELIDNVIIDATPVDTPDTSEE